MQKMKKGFTLVELLVVVTVISILMAMVMRFGSITSASTERNKTINRMQRMENALSGYYAAYGSYPPVRVDGSRDIYRKVDDDGVQSDDPNERNENLWGWVDKNGNVTSENAEEDAWEQVKAACQAQAVACYFPYSSDYAKQVAKVSSVHKLYAEERPEDIAVKQREKLLKGYSVGGVDLFQGKYRDKSKWSEIQLFRFGLLSYLLPRYLFVIKSDPDYLQFAQWTEDNRLGCDPMTGIKYTNWEDYQRTIKRVEGTPQENIYFQTSCARWMMNFEGMLSCNYPWRFYGVDVQDDSSIADGLQEIRLIESNTNIKIFTPGGYREGSGAGQYVLDGISVADGWGTDLFYYSPSPYQSYILWSAGPNKRTFPPWISLDALSEEAKRCVRYWANDDIVSMKR